MSTGQYSPNQTSQPSGWALGGVAFAACMLTLLGVFEVISGLTALFNDTFFVVAPHYTFKFDVTVWGWIHLILGIIMIATAIGLFTTKGWALVTGIVFATLSAIANFFFIPYYPLWSIVIIALNAWVIWSLTRPGIAED